MVIEKLDGTLLVTVGTKRVGVFAWDEITKSEMKDVLKAIQELGASEQSNRFRMKCVRTGKEIVVQSIHAKSA